MNENVFKTLPEADLYKEQMQNYSELSSQFGYFGDFDSMCMDVPSMIF